MTHNLDSIDKQLLLARLAAERARLLWQFWGVDGGTLSTALVTDAWTAKDMLPHIADWDRLHAAWLGGEQNGRFAPLQRPTNIDQWNIERHEAQKTLPLESALAVFSKERGGYMAAIKRLFENGLEGEMETAVFDSASKRYQHDDAHAQELRAWQQTLPQDREKRGPRSILRALLKATRKEFLTLAALIPVTERSTRQVCGVWTLQDLLGHLADWEAWGAKILNDLTARKEPTVDNDLASDIDQVNMDWAKAREGQSWERVWADYQNAHRQLLQAYDNAPKSAMAQAFVTQWDEACTGYTFTTIWAEHAQDHAIDLRMALNLTSLPAYLVR